MSYRSKSNRGKGRGGGGNQGRDAVPGLNLEQIDARDNEGAQGSSGRARSHRSVVQPVGTIFKLLPEHWNNVPVVVYEAVVAIIAAVDEGEVQKKQKFDDVNKQFRELRQLVGAAEAAFKSENDKLIDQTEQDKKVTKE